MLTDPEKFRRGLKAACLVASAAWGAALLAGAWVDAESVENARPGVLLLAWTASPAALGAALTLRFSGSWRKLAALCAGLAAAGAVGSFTTVAGPHQGGDVPVSTSLPMFTLPVMALAGLLAHFLPPEK